MTIFKTGGAAGFAVQALQPAASLFSLLTKVSKLTNQESALLWSDLVCYFSLSTEHTSTLCSINQFFAALSAISIFLHKRWK
ncbi:hypothetical protein [Desulfovibrio desulfuricans]|uniref:hypothetical protein n=1 Tax=Desulfovibrio desulfuricans TaxID=876 RepID=UPI0039844D03